MARRSMAADCLGGATPHAAQRYRPPADPLAADLEPARKRAGDGLGRGVAPVVSKRSRSWHRAAALVAGGRAGNRRAPRQRSIPCGRLTDTKMKMADPNM